MYLIFLLLFSQLNLSLKLFEPTFSYFCTSGLWEHLPTSYITVCMFQHRWDKVSVYRYNNTHTHCVALTLSPTLSKYSWNLFSTSLDRLVQLVLIFSICSCWLLQVRWKVIWCGNRLLILLRKSLVTVWIPSREWAKSSLHFLVRNKAKSNETGLTSTYSVTRSVSTRARAEDTWCRWRAAPAAWCWSCARWWPRCGVCLGRSGPRLSPCSSAARSGWSLPWWARSALVGESWSSAESSSDLERATESRQHTLWSWLHHVCPQMFWSRGFKATLIFLTATMKITHKC